MSKEIKFAVTPEERDRLDIEAAAHGVSRAQLVRDRALNAGIIPRVQMEPEAQERAVRNLSEHFVGVLRRTSALGECELKPWRRRLDESPRCL